VLRAPSNLAFNTSREEAISPEAPRIQRCEKPSSALRYSRFEGREVGQEMGLFLGLKHPAFKRTPFQKGELGFIPVCTNAVADSVCDTVRPAPRGVERCAASHRCRKRVWPVFS